MKEYIIKEYEMEDYNAARETMTDEKVIILLEYIKRGYIGDYNFIGTEDDFERYELHQALCHAILALTTKGTQAASANERIHRA